MNNFRNLEVWKRTIILIKEIYTIAEKLPRDEEYNLKQQLKRAIFSVALNIAEGKNRCGDKEFSYYINIAIGSISEVEAVLIICEELQYLKVNDEIYSKVTELSKMLVSLRKKLKANG